MTHIDRRDFLKTCCAGGLAAGAASAPRLLLGAPAANGYDTLVVVFLRGAMDGLSLVSPGANNPDRAKYEEHRGQTQIALSGANAGLPLGSDGLWNLHPAAPELASLYADQRLAVVLGTGMPGPVSRSHADAQLRMELGLASPTAGSGWLTRTLASSWLPGSVAIPAVSAGSITATSLLASLEAITLSSSADFILDTASWAWNILPDFGGEPAGARGLFTVLPELWTGSTPFEAAGRGTLDALGVVSSLALGDYVPAPGVSYPAGDFSTQLQMLAQLIKADVGLRVATIDIGGWDTHNGQNYYFATATQQLSQGLAAFQADLANDPGGYGERVSVIAMSEFGRRVQENADAGTDHGYGNLMLALGGPVNGGRTYGAFAGLQDDQLFEGSDVMVTTDYRQVLSEALIRRLANPNVYYVFPGYAGYAPLGIFAGSDLPPGNFDTVFSNGFD
jgi:uncharacterized protein (DUF1501 family)